MGIATPPDGTHLLRRPPSCFLGTGKQAISLGAQAFRKSTTASLVLVAVWIPLRI